MGYCGLRTAEDGQLVQRAGGPDAGLVDWYHDPLPTNCVGDWVCPAGTGAGYPTFSVCDGPEHGYRNLAVFYDACNFDCLFCQNWHFRERQRSAVPRTAHELAAAADSRTTCICYFGGDPTPQIEHALVASAIARERAKGRILRICWETNGAMTSRDLDRAAALSLESGGCVKFDLKAWDEKLHVALTGVSNRQTLSNFARLVEIAGERPSPPFAIASTLLVPGYVDAEEVGAIAQFIAALDPQTPYSLLAFAPQYQMRDLPTTSRRQADECLAAAQEAGLQCVRVGNVHLLS